MINLALSTARKKFRPGGIGRHISWLLLHSLIESGTMTVAALLAARWFGPIVWGKLGILLTGVQLISMMSDGLYGTIVKFVAEAKIANPRLAGHLGLRLVTISFLLFLFTSIAMGVLAKAIFPTQLSPLWIVLAVVLATTRGWRAAFDGAYRGLQEFQIPAVAGIVSSSLMAGGIIALAATGYRVGGYLSAMVAASILNCAWLLWAYRKKFSADQETSSFYPKEGLRDFLKYSYPLALRGLTAFFFLKINVWMLGWLASDYDAGQFRLTDQFLTIPALMLSATLAAVAPRIAEAQLQGGNTLSELMARVYTFMLVLTLPLALFFYLNGPLMALIFPAYIPASKMLALFAPSMAVQGLGYAASIVLVQGGRPGAAFWLTFGSGVTNVIAAYAGYKLGGVWGLATATASVHFLTYIAITVVTHRLFKLPFRLRLY